MTIQTAVSNVGGQTALAVAINARQQEVWNWLNGRPIPSVRCPAIERVSGVAVEELRPDVCWVRVPDPTWPHPAGRPCIDVAGGASAGACGDERQESGARDAA